ncbi:hypothetical protein JYU34_010948, partial [Plutella xylostella]
RPGPGGAAMAAGAMNQLPPHMKQQINQAVGQAVTNAAINELSSAFARFNRPVPNVPPKLPERPQNGRPY